MMKYPKYPKRPQHASHEGKYSDSPVSERIMSARSRIAAYVLFKTHDGSAFDGFVALRLNKSDRQRLTDEISPVLISEFADKLLISQVKTGRFTRVEASDGLYAEIEHGHTGRYEVLRPLGYADESELVAKN